MGDIFLPGLGPKFTNWQECFDQLIGLMPTADDAKILAAIPGPESGYDMHIINDTPATGDYSCGLWQINYLGSLYAERTREFGTPRHLLESGVAGQARAAFRIWQQQGFMAWSTTYTSGAWRKYVGDNSTPTPSGGGDGGGGIVGPVISDNPIFARIAHQLARDAEDMVRQGNALMAIGRSGWRP